MHSVLAARRMQQTHATGSIVGHEFRATKKNRKLDLFPAALLAAITTIQRMLTANSAKQKISDKIYCFFFYLKFSLKDRDFMRNVQFCIKKNLKMMSNMAVQEEQE